MRDERSGFEQLAQLIEALILFSEASELTVLLFDCPLERLQGREDRGRSGFAPVAGRAPRPCTQWGAVLPSHTVVVRGHGPELSSAAFGDCLEGGQSLHAAVRGQLLDLGEDLLADVPTRIFIILTSTHRVHLHEYLARILPQADKINDCAFLGSDRHLTRRVGTPLAAPLLTNDPLHSLIASVSMNEHQQIVRHCSDWAENVRASIQLPGAWVFGSLIHRDGAQFETALSDIDFVVVIPFAQAPQRAAWLTGFRAHKAQLELSLIPLLGRTDASHPIVSIVAVTDVEIAADIHKSGVTTFFRENTFTDLLSNHAAGPLLAGAPIEMSDTTRQVFQFVQGVRNKFLAISAARKMVLAPWDDVIDPVPKDLMRMAAIATERSRERKFDVQEGLDSITNHLYLQRDAHPDYLRLHEWLSVRRRARGKPTALSPEDHLLLVEALYDMVDPGVERNQLSAGSRRSTSRPYRASSTVADLEGVPPPSFTISTSGRLAGSDRDVSASIDEAEVNLKWRREPAFTVRVSNAEMIEGHRVKPSPLRTARERSRQAKLIDRRNRVSFAVPLIEKGLRYLMFYQHLLFPANRFAASRRSSLLKSMHVYVQRALTPERRGGFLQASKALDDQRDLVVDFSLPHEELSTFLVERFGEANILALAANNQHVSALAPDLLTLFFIPELLLYVVIREQDGRLEFTSEDQKDWALSLEGWNFGPR